jgi:NADPH:quinone reductase
MKAAVVRKAGPPEVLELTEIPTPVPEPGSVLVRVKALGLNRGELFTRQGHSPAVKFPRILGLECVGTVEAAPGGEFAPGTTVFAMSGGMGRNFDGSYAEFACVPAACIFPIEKQGLDWTVLASLPVSYITAYGALIDVLELAPGQNLLIRGGTSSVGVAAIAVAKAQGANVFPTTRREDRRAALIAAGADDVFVDTGTLAPAVRERFPGGIDAVLELVGTATLVDSMRATRPRGTVCMAGIVGNAWSFDFTPGEMIPTGVRLTYFSSVTTPFEGDTRGARVQHVIDAVADGRYRSLVDQVFPFSEIVAAHRCMEENKAIGKIVVTVAA